MADFPDTTKHVSPEMAAILENLQKKNNSINPSATATAATAPGTAVGLTSGSSVASRQNIMNSSSTSSVKETSSSQQVSQAKV